MKLQQARWQVLFIPIFLCFSAAAHYVLWCLVSPFHYYFSILINTWSLGFGLLLKTHLNRTFCLFYVLLWYCIVFRFPLIYWNENLILMICWYFKRKYNTVRTQMVVCLVGLYVGLWTCLLFRAYPTHNDCWTWTPLTPVERKKWLKIMGRGLFKLWIT